MHPVVEAWVLARFLFRLDADGVDLLRQSAITRAGAQLRDAARRPEAPGSAEAARRALDELRALPWPAGIVELIDIARARIPAPATEIGQRPPKR